MTTILIIAAIFWCWILFGVATYTAWREDWKRSFGVWRVRDRRTALFVAAMGPIGIGVVISILWDYLPCIDENAEASW